jgi:hypothetical protein
MDELSMYTFRFMLANLQSGQIDEASAAMEDIAIDVCIETGL